MQRHNCMRQELKAAEIYTIPGEHARKEEGSEVKEVECAGRPVAKKQHIKSSSMGSAQHKQFHCLMAIRIIKDVVPFIKLECPLLE